jgi:hypothetical protein
MRNPKRRLTSRNAASRQERQPRTLSWACGSLSHIPTGPPGGPGWRNAPAGEWSVRFSMRNSKRRLTSKTREPPTKTRPNPLGKAKAGSLFHRQSHGQDHSPPGQARVHGPLSYRASKTFPDFTKSLHSRPASTHGPLSYRASKNARTIFLQGKQARTRPRPPRRAHADAATAAGQRVYYWAKERKKEARRERESKKNQKQKNQTNHIRLRPKPPFYLVPTHAPEDHEPMPSTAPRQAHAPCLPCKTTRRLGPRPLGPSSYRAGKRTQSSPSRLSSRASKDAQTPLLQGKQDPSQDPPPGQARPVPRPSSRASKDIHTILLQGKQELGFDFHQVPSLPSYRASKDARAILLQGKQAPRGQLPARALPPAATMPSSWPPPRPSPGLLALEETWVPPPHGKSAQGQRARRALPEKRKKRKKKKKKKRKRKKHSNKTEW